MDWQNCCYMYDCVVHSLPMDSHMSHTNCGNDQKYDDSGTDQMDKMLIHKNRDIFTFGDLSPSIQHDI